MISKKFMWVKLKRDVFVKTIALDMANSKMAKITRTNILIQVDRSCHRKDRLH